MNRSEQQKGRKQNHSGLEVMLFLFTIFSRLPAKVRVFLDLFCPLSPLPFFSFLPEHIFLSRPDASSQESKSLPCEFCYKLPPKQIIDVTLHVMPPPYSTYYLLCFHHLLAFCSFAFQVVPGTRSRLLRYYLHDETCPESYFALQYKHGQDRMTPMLTVDERIDSFTRGTRSWPHPETFRATPSSVRHKLPLASTGVLLKIQPCLLTQYCSWKLSLRRLSLVVSIVACRGRILLEAVLKFSRQCGLLSLREIS